MKKDPKVSSNYFYDEQGASYVSEQIMNAYNSGVIDQSDGTFDLSKFAETEEDY